MRRALQHVVMTSGGTGSWKTAQLVHEAMGPRDTLTLLFADTRQEDVDLYRFLDESSALLPRARQVVLDQGEDVWDVFARKRFIGNTRLDPCSYYLKRVPMREWIERWCDPATTVCYLGIDWTESHRLVKALRYWEPWDVRAPLCDPPYLTKEQIHAELEAAGVALPALTREGFPHNNCGGACVKAGQGHWKMLLERRPETYDLWERRENEMRDLLGDVPSLRGRRGGTTRPLPLTVLRRRVQADEAVDEHDVGGCGCAVGDLDQDAELLEAMRRG